MVGWGLKNNDIAPDELQEARVTLADRSMCQGSNRYTDMCVRSRSNTSPMGLINFKTILLNKNSFFSLEHAPVIVVVDYFNKQF